MRRDGHLSMRFFVKACKVVSGICGEFAGCLWLGNFIEQMLSGFELGIIKSFPEPSTNVLQDLLGFLFFLSAPSKTGQGLLRL